MHHLRGETEARVPAKLPLLFNFNLTYCCERNTSALLSPPLLSHLDFNRWTERGKEVSHCVGRDFSEQLTETVNGLQLRQGYLSDLSSSSTVTEGIMQLLSQTVKRGLDVKMVKCYF